MASHLDVSMPRASQASLYSAEDMPFPSHSAFFTGKRRTLDATGAFLAVVFVVFILSI